MRLSRVLALTAAAALLAGCNDSSKDTTATDLPDVVTTTTAVVTAAVTPAATTAAATATSTSTPTPAKTASPTPTARRTTARPMVTATTAKPTPRPTTAKPTPKPVVTTPPPATGTFALSISGRAFHPQVFSIPRGTTVRATNNDAYPHDWTSNSGVWASGSMGFHETYSYRFMTKGSFNFTCTIHPDMTGKVTVT